MRVLLILIMMIQLDALAFDFGDYAMTYGYTQDAYLKAGRELRLAETDLQNFLNSNTLVPTRVDRFHEFGLANSDCSAVKNCKTAKSESKVKEIVAAAVADPDIRALVSDATVWDQLKDDVDSYYAHVNSSMVNDQQILFEAQSTVPVLNSQVIEEIANFESRDPSQDPVTMAWSDYRRYYDGYLKALIEMQLATAPFFASKAGMSEAVTVMNYTNCNGFGGFGVSFEQWIKDGKPSSPPSP